MKALKPSPSFIVLLIIVFAVWAWVMWIEAQATRYQTVLGPEIRNNYGFAHGSPYVQAGEQRTEVFTIYPTANGPLAEAGFRNGDIVVSEGISGFYKLLYEPRGETITVTVVDGGDGPPIGQRAPRVISILARD